MGRKEKSAFGQKRSLQARVRISRNRVNRAWIEGLLGSLRPQAERIFQSTLEESVIAGGIGIFPDHNVEQGLQQEIEFMKSDSFAEAMQKEEQEFRNDPEDFPHDH